MPYSVHGLRYRGKDPAILESLERETQTLKPKTLFFSKTSAEAISAKPLPKEAGSTVKKVSSAYDSEQLHGWLSAEDKQFIIGMAKQVVQHKFAQAFMAVFNVSPFTYVLITILANLSPVSAKDFVQKLFKYNATGETFSIFSPDITYEIIDGIPENHTDLCFQPNFPPITRCEQFYVQQNASVLARGASFEFGKPGRNMDWWKSSSRRLLSRKFSKPSTKLQETLFVAQPQAMVMFLYIHGLWVFQRLHAENYYQLIKNAMIIFTI